MVLLWYENPAIMRYCWNWGGYYFTSYIITVYMKCCSIDVPDNRFVLYCRCWICAFWNYLRIWPEVNIWWLFLVVHRKRCQELEQIVILGFMLWPGRRGRKARDECHSWPTALQHLRQPRGDGQREKVCVYRVTSSATEADEFINHKP